MRGHTQRIIRPFFETLFVCLLSITMVGVSHADFWYEDFADGSLDDAGIEWASSPDPERVPSISTDGLLASTGLTCCASWLAPDWPRDRPGWSIRTRGRLLQDHGFFGAGTSGPEGTRTGTFNLISAGGKAVVGIRDDHVLADTDLNPLEEDVIVQLDTFDGVLRMWAWREREQPDEDIAPLLEERFDLPVARPYIWVRSDDGPSAGVIRWVAFSTDHVPVNMSMPLSDLVGDFSGNDILDVADINELASRIRAGSVDQPLDLNSDGIVDLKDHSHWVTDIKQTSIGDANLDGEFNSSDFVEAFQAGKYATDEAATWSQGDWNADGFFNSSDFVIAFQDGGYEIGASTVAAAVPEPSAAMLLMLSLVGVARIRKRH